MRNLLFGVINQSFFDSYWAVLHFASGIVIGFLILLYFKRKKVEIPARRFARIGFGSLLLWEYFELSLRFMDKYQLRLEDYLKIIVPSSFFEPESLTNITSDLILGSFGLYLIYLYFSSDPNRRDDQK